MGPPGQPGAEGPAINPRSKSDLTRAVLKRRPLLWGSSRPHPAGAQTDRCSEPIVRSPLPPGGWVRQWPDRAQPESYARWTYRSDGRAAGLSGKRRSRTVARHLCFSSEVPASRPLPANREPLSAPPTSSAALLPTAKTSVRWPATLASHFGTTYRSLRGHGSGVTATTHHA
jgi:hypothetical protein